MKGSGYTKEDILRFVGERSFERGKAYARDGMVFDGARRKSSLLARCHGTLGSPYHVEVMLNAKGRITGGECSCPVGVNCKHMAALLLTYLDEPDKFPPYEDPMAVLGKYSRQDLLSLLKRMLALHPELEQFLRITGKGRGKKSHQMPARVLFMQQAIAAVRQSVRGEGNPWETANALKRLLKAADDLRENGYRSEAVAAYVGLTDGMLRSVDIAYEEEGEISGILADCAVALGECLADLKEAAERKPVVQSLFDIYAWDIAQGGIGIGDDIPDLLHAGINREERAWIVTEILDRIKKSDAGWQKGMWREFLYAIDS